MAIAVGVAGGNWIGRIVHPHDRNGPCRCPGGMDRRSTHGVDHIDFESDQLLGRIGKARGVPTGTAELERQVLSDDPTMLRENALEWLEPGLPVLYGQDSDARDLRLSPALSSPSEGGQQRNANKE
jgi:hypothetical protein